MERLWHDLPNAAHIDRILADVRARPEAWDAAGDAAWDAWDAAWDAAAVAAWDAARAAARVAAGAILALMAWDDCAHLLDTDPEQVRLLALLGHHPAVLLYPACVALQVNAEPPVPAQCRPEFIPPGKSPDYDRFGYALAMRVLQSDLYHQLDERERSECDEFIRAATGKESEHDKR